MIAVRTLSSVPRVPIVRRGERKVIYLQCATYGVLFLLINASSVQPFCPGSTVTVTRLSPDPSCSSCSLFLLNYSLAGLLEWSGFWSPLTQDSRLVRFPLSLDLWLVIPVFFSFFPKLATELAWLVIPARSTCDHRFSLVLFVTSDLFSLNQISYRATGDSRLVIALSFSYKFPLGLLEWLPLLIAQDSRL